MIDCHVHSTHSDGSETPAALARQGKAVGLSLMALTDHDACSGGRDFLAACQAVGLDGVAGIEMDVRSNRGSLHVLGLGIDPDNAALHEAALTLKDRRVKRNHLIIERLHDLGIDFTLDEVRAYAKDELVSRVHFALALVDRGYCTDVRDAMARYVGQNGAVHVINDSLPPETCLRLITSAGGVAFMAHPFTYDRDASRIAKALGAMIPLGLTGIEAYYGRYDTEETLELLRLAKQLNLPVSAGSDFHGIAKPDIHLGTLVSPPEVEATLRRCLAHCPGKTF